MTSVGGMLDHRVVTRQWLNVPLIYTPSFLFVYQGEWWGGGGQGRGGGGGGNIPSCLRL